MVKAGRARPMPVQAGLQGFGKEEVERERRKGCGGGGGSRTGRAGAILATAAI